MRRGIGVGALQRKTRDASAYTKVGEASKSAQLKHIREVLEEFKLSVEKFAIKHKTRINEDPEFRHRFHKMCSTLKVDPLASYKGYWADILGLGDYYFQLAVIVAQISVETRITNGGMIPFGDIIHHLKGSSKSGIFNKVSEDDIKRAVLKLRVLGNGFRIIKVSEKNILVSADLNFSTDHENLLQLAQENGYVNEEMCSTHFTWASDRFSSLITPMIQEGIVWIDFHREMRQMNYYFPSMSQGEGSALYP